MLFLPGNLLVSLLLLILPLRFALAQTTAPYPYAYCSNNVIDGGSYCPGSSTNCCAASAACCAGGCCPQLYDCIYQGTANEACCPASDPSACGAAQPVCCLVIETNKAAEANENDRKQRLLVLPIQDSSQTTLVSEQIAIGPVRITSPATMRQGAVYPL